METWNTAGYLRLSREDGDKAESDSIANQRKLLEQYLSAHPELQLVEFYQDDGYTGTNFDRPAFRRMEEDIEAGKVNCVLVKDDCVIKALTPQTLENRHFSGIGTAFRAIQRPQRAAYHIETS